MLSTTESSRGQVLPIFALSLVALLGAAALAFDAGLLYVERRDQQNAADAAALAGAHYLPGAPGDARTAALLLAEKNGYAAGRVTVTTPYAWSGMSTGDHSASFINVEISETRPSFFASVLGFLDWNVSARAVAANEDDVLVDFSILSLDTESCPQPGIEVAGKGFIDAAGDVHADSGCSNGAIKMVSNKSSIQVIVGDKKGACSAVGPIKGDTGDTSQWDCTVITPAPWVGDPFESKPDPPERPASIPDSQAMQLLGPDDSELEIPDGCPGSDNPASSLEPAVCQFPANYKDTSWLVQPGLYPGGLKLNAGTFYLMPGVYYIEGGGIDLGGGEANVISVASATEPFPTGEDCDGGVLIYNTKSDLAPAGPINLNGGDSDFCLKPYRGGDWDGFVVFQDRSLTEEITLNGSDTDMSVRGTVYSKLGHVKINGSAAEITLDQIIANTFYISGGGGTINAERKREFVPDLTIAGLVE